MSGIAPEKLLEKKPTTARLSIAAMGFVVLWQVVLSVSDFSFRRMVAEHDTLKESHSKLQLDVAKNYVTREELHNSMLRIEGKIDELFNDVHRGK